MKTTRTLALALFSLALPSLALAGSPPNVEFIGVDKGHAFIQTSSGAPTEILTNPWQFRVFVEDGAADLTSVPGSFTSATGSIVLGGSLTHDVDEGSRDFSQGFANESLLNASFASGDYTVTVATQSVVLTLGTAAYPVTPMLTSASQGVWSGGQLIVDASQELILTTNGFTGNGVLAHMGLFISGSSYNFDSENLLALPDDSPPFVFAPLTHTVSANSFISGQTYTLEIEFNHGTDLDLPNSGFLSGATAVAIYTTRTLITISAIPEPSTYAALVGAGALGLAIWRRRRARA